LKELLNPDADKSGCNLCQSDLDLTNVYVPDLYIANLYIALMHSNVINKKGDLITSAVTNLDLHDMARAAKTFGVRKFYIVTPLEDQKTLVKQITSHWITGVGGELNPSRKEALELISVKDSMAQVKEDIFARENDSVKVVATTARKCSYSTSFGKLRQILDKKSSPVLLTFGTAWGLSEQFISNVDYVLEPIAGCAGYNHLSVRSAASIILYKLLGGMDS